MIITICIGSSCHLKGSKEVVEKLQNLINNNHLEGTVELNGSFCMDNCVNGVSVKVGEEIFSLTPESTETFFDREILGRNDCGCNRI